MRFLIAPDKFKGSLTAAEAARAIETGLRRVFPDAEYECVPIADGGEGTADIFEQVLGGERMSVQVQDPLGRPVEVWYLIQGGKAVIELSQASGLRLMERKDRNPLRATTMGTGQMVKHAAERGVKEIVLTLGGSGTNDAGVGLAAAVGWTFRDAMGNVLDPLPENFSLIERIVPPENGWSVPLTALCDVQNPLLGPHGATRVYGPQKGAAPEMVETLENGLTHLADVVARELGHDFRTVPGAGATGGTAYGVMSFFSGRLERGFEVVARLLDLESRVAAADVVITGEGRVDHQTAHGKAPAELAGMARRHRKPILSFAGEDGGSEGVFDAVVPIPGGPMSLEECQARAGELLERAAKRAAGLLRAGGMG